MKFKKDDVVRFRKMLPGKLIEELANMGIDSPASFEIAKPGREFVILGPGIDPKEYVTVRGSWIGQWSGPWGIKSHVLERVRLPKLK